jgi:2'-5' RNA ligase
MFAVWLIPEKKDKEYLGKIIKNLSQKYNSPKFLPHITIYGLVNLEPSILEVFIKSSVKNLKSFKIKNTGVGYSDQIWKSIFINIESNDDLNLINNRLTKNLNFYSSYQFDPHISLIYKQMPIPEKRKIIDDLKIKKEFAVDKITVQKYSENINEWKIVKEFSF